MPFNQYLQYHSQPTMHPSSPTSFNLGFTVMDFMIAVIPSRPMGFIPSCLCACVMVNSCVTTKKHIHY